MRYARPIGLVASLALALLFPLWADSATTSMAIFTLIFAGMATGWNMFSGYTGYISLGHMVYYGLGAYTLAIACQDWHIPGGSEPLLLLPLAGLVAGVLAIPLGWIALRTRRYTFMVITIAIFFLFQVLAYNLPASNGSAACSSPTLRGAHRSLTFRSTMSPCSTSCRRWRSPGGCGSRNLAWASWLSAMMRTALVRWG